MLGILIFPQFRQKQHCSGLFFTRISMPCQPQLEWTKQRQPKAWTEGNQILSDTRSRARTRKGTRRTYTRKTRETRKAKLLHRYRPTSEIKRQYASKIANSHRHIE